MRIPPQTNWPTIFPLFLACRFVFICSGYYLLPSNIAKIVISKKGVKNKMDEFQANNSRKAMNKIGRI
jgi:hypothetical protein